MADWWWQWINGVNGLCFVTLIGGSTITHQNHSAELALKERINGSLQQTARHTFSSKCEFLTVPQLVSKLAQIVIYYSIFYVFAQLLRELMCLGIKTNEGFDKGSCQLNALNTADIYGHSERLNDWNIWVSWNMDQLQFVTDAIGLMIVFLLMCTVILLLFLHRNWESHTEL